MLISANVDGNVRAAPGSVLFIYGGEIGGNIQSDPGSSLVVLSSIVDGNIRCTGAADPSGCQVSGAIVDGNVQSTDAESGFVSFFFNNIDGNVSVSGSDVQSFVSLNTIDGNLQCRGNSPAPNPGGLPPTNVADDKEDQCAASLGF